MATAGNHLMTGGGSSLASIDDVHREFLDAHYLMNRGLATATYLALTMSRPILLEGEPGVGKTELARTAARVLGRHLIRLQCYEGIDANQALYEWDYPRQLLSTRVAAEGPNPHDMPLRDLYGEEFLIERPLLTAIRYGSAAVLLIDELDRADDQFEAFLLEVLSEYAVTIPEYGTVSATSAPLVVITSNRTRDLHEALKRRCLYHWIEFPDQQSLVEIIRLRNPGVSEQLSRSVATTIERVRELNLMQMPGSAEAIDWACSLALLGADAVTSEAARATLGLAIKNADDLELVNQNLEQILDA
jgi:MoxR-like ATPase